jgi:3-deoxy-manno-octulosonate cytidylyltransferase (CMP-KDO synthetase)
LPSTFGHVLAVIPARLSSTRLPRKVLREIAGEPMIAWVYRAARACPLLDQVLIATDSDEVIQFAQAHGLPAVFTPVDCASGTDRVHAVAQSIPADLYVNIQGDEPLLTPEHFTPMLELFERPEVQVATLAVRCPEHDVNNPNAVKVVTASDDRALYFSRATIPFDRDGGFAGYRKHLGVYAYRKAALERFASLPPSWIERVERLEQLRLLDNGIDIHVAGAPSDTIGVDTEEDLRAAEAVLSAREQQTG